MSWALASFSEELIESEILALAHDENIESWIERVEQHLDLYPEINLLSEIVEHTSLSLSQVFIAGLFAFKIESAGNFYDANQIKLFIFC